MLARGDDVKVIQLSAVFKGGLWWTLRMMGVEAKFDSEVIRGFVLPSAVKL